MVEAAAEGKDWTWSALRPSVVCGFALGIPMNLAMVIAVYAADLQALGRAAALSRQARRLPRADRDDRRRSARRATVWAATDPAAANEAFNINNGDLFRWNEMWPKLADYFEPRPRRPLPMSLADVMADKGPALEGDGRRHGTSLPPPTPDVSSWPFGDVVFSWDYDLIADGSKARRYGFHEYVDTAAMFSGSSTRCASAGSFLVHRSGLPRFRR